MKSITVIDGKMLWDVIGILWDVPEMVSSDKLQQLLKDLTIGYPFSHLL